MESSFVQDVMKVVEIEEQDTVRAMFSNYALTGERFEDGFEYIKYQLETEADSVFGDAMHAVQVKLIISRLKNYFDEEFARKQKSNSGNANAGRQEGGK